MIHNERPALIYIYIYIDREREIGGPNTWSNFYKGLKIRLAITIEGSFESFAFLEEVLRGEIRASLVHLE